MLGLVGAHRVGKTTLARAYSEKTGIPFLQTNVGAIFAALGLDPAQPYTFGERLDIQERILSEVDNVFAQYVGENIITDRTPIDMLAYTMAEATPLVLGEEEELRLKKYMDRCIEVANRRFSALVLVQPGIPLVAEEGKAVASPGYIEHLSAMMLGLIVDERVKPAHFYLPRHLTDMEDRLKALDYVVSRVKQMAFEQREGYPMH